MEYQKLITLADVPIIAAISGELFMINTHDIVNDLYIITESIWE